LKEIFCLISVMFLLGDDILILFLNLLDILNISLSRDANFVNSVKYSVFWCSLCNTVQKHNTRPSCVSLRRTFSYECTVHCFYLTPNTDIIYSIRFCQQPISVVAENKKKSLAFLYCFSKYFKFRSPYGWPRSPVILNVGCGIISTFISVLLSLKLIITFVQKLVLNDMTPNKGKQKSEDR